MLQHFSSSEVMMLCTDIAKSVKLAKSLPSNVLEQLRRLPSFRPYVELQMPQIQIKLLTDDEYFKQKLVHHIKGFHTYLGYFHMLLRCFNILIEDLPRAPVGKQVIAHYYVYS